jgi:translation elongation factor P/translation initiation factor 5A
MPYNSKKNLVRQGKCLRHRIAAHYRNFIFSMNIENGFEKKECTPRASTLDVIEVDGRLAQYAGGESNNLIFLDDESIGSMGSEDWNKYVFEPAKMGEDSVSFLKRQGQISEIEYERVHWGPEQKKHPHLKGVVTFFGKYKKK